MTINISGIDVLIDKDDLIRVIESGPWRAHQGSKNQYFVHTTARPQHKNILLHRFIASAPNGLEVDHINGNTLDNRKSNLRICTHLENIRNSKKRINSKTSFKGITRAHSKSERWCANICVNGKNMHLGTYSTKEKAHEAYSVAALIMFGEYARTK